MLNFTRQERVVIYFLVITLGLGALVRMIRNRNLESRLVPTRFYQEEKRFKEVADAINTGSAEIFEDKDTMADGVELGQSDGLTDSLAQTPIDLNRASIEKLMQLPGIGPTLAKRIRAYTDQNGPFKNKADIKLVKGIGDKMYTRIEELVTTE